MIETLHIPTDELVVNRQAVLEYQGIPVGHTASAETARLFEEATDLLTTTAAPVGTLAEITHHNFDQVYRGEGLNEPSTPVGDIFPSAEALILFAVTLGDAVSHEIERRFADNDFAVGCMLDSCASVAAEHLATLIQDQALDLLSAAGKTTPDTRALVYSPGYCGWHVSGQRKLFDYLKPEKIGILLRDSFLMQPLKSVSGVIIVGPASIHEFDAVYFFCNTCTTHGCRERIRALLAG